ncbi:hypothetical protein C2S51_015867 [Perilla frutescens var. frutescens]|nr:hypothetical protein C2S51_015867 [Perilla frutescens var. frutescens]
MNNGSLNLIVKSETIWVLAESAYATEAAILETGNFVLRNASSILWQSLENPTDSWLPRGMVGYRWSTSNTEAKLVSWRSMNDPANGDYSLGMEPNGGSELFIKNNGSKKLWRSGVLQGGTFTSLSSVSDSYKFSSVSVENNVYFSYNVYNESMLVRIVLDYLGFMKHYVWSEVKQEWIELVVQPSDSCNTYARCGPNAVCSVNFSPVCQCLDGFAPIVERDWAAFDFSAGCRRIRPLQCDEENPRFMEVSSVSFPAYAELLEVRRDGVCELVCRVNCSYSAYGYGDGIGCLLFTGELLDLESLPESSGRTLYVRMNVEDPRKGKRKVVLVSLVASITTAMLICIFCICYLWQKKLKSKESRGTGKNILLLDLNTNGAADNKCASVRNSQVEELSDRFELPIFSFSSIAASTNNFSTMSKLGEGGFGPVYKHPAFTVGRSLPRAHPMQNEGEVCSVNGLTVSHMEAR